MKYIFSILLLTCFLAINAQNLVNNAGFETLKKVDENRLMDAIDFSFSVPNWKVHKSGIVCNCQIEKTEEDIYHNRCNPKYEPHSGCSMIQMNFHPNCAVFGDGNFPYIGCANYLISPLQKKMEIGQVYEISFWVNFTDIFVNQDPDAHSHLGMLVGNKIVRPSYLYAITKNTTFIAPPLPYNQWTKVTWHVIPTCELNYLIIGIFKDSEWPQYNNPAYDRSIYFIDDVTVRAVRKEEHATLTPKYFCKEPPEEDAFTAFDMTLPTCYFDVADWHLTSASKRSLDSFAIVARKFKNTIFEVMGHTDNTGEGNRELSKKRTQSVINYLVQRQSLPSYRFIPEYFGDTQPTATNDTETGRQQNRRVQIFQSQINKSSALYRKAMTYLSENKIDSTFMMLRGWEFNENDNQKILALFDPRFDKIKKDKRWQKIEKNIKKSYQKFSHPEQAFTLDSLYCEDQKYRRLGLFINDIGGYIPRIDSVKWDFPQIGDEAWKALDKKNSTFLLRYLHKNGLAKESDVGRRAAKSAPVILIHSGDTISIKKYLPILESYCREGEGQWKYYAMLYDKLCSIRGIPQKYGSQYITDKTNPSKMILYKIEGIEAVNAARRKIGLQPMKSD